jgi:tetratricopeptide (TPR) repeat protein
MSRRYHLISLPTAGRAGDLWSAPDPIVAVAPDWRLNWHAYRRCLPFCDLVLTDPEGAEVIRRHGFAHVRGVELPGNDPSLAALPEDEWDGLAEQARRRPALAGEEALLARTGLALAVGGTADPALVADLDAALAANPSAALHNARGLAEAVAARQGGPTTSAVAERVAPFFHRALRCDPRHAVAALNLVEALVGMGKDALAAEGARRLLRQLAGDGGAIGPAVLDAGRFPPGLDPFRREWERAAWANAGRPAAEAVAKVRLLRGRLHALLDEVTGGLAARKPRPRVSLCLIVKDEEPNLPACLRTAADLVDEIIVVDTGSADRTKEVAAHFGARVFDFAWVDSFAAARNESLRHAAGDWVFWLDADDRLDRNNRQKLRALFDGLGEENVAYVMKCLCLPDPESNAATVVDHVRLFRNDPALRWEYRVHEQILPAVRRSGGEVRWADVVIHHTGYQDRALRGRKLQRDLRLLRLEQAERPDDPFILFNLGAVHQELGRPAEALPLLRRSLELSQPTDSIVRKLYALIAQGQRQLGQPAAALAACAGGRRHYPDDTELLFVEGMLRREQGDPAAAEALLVRLLASQPGAHFGCVDTGLRGHKARHHLALACRQQGREEDAEAHWRAALAERPDFVPGWLGLGEVLLAERRWDGLDEVCRRLEGLAQGRMEAAVLRARGHMARREFGPARGLLGEAVASDPRALWPRVILSHALLQEGKDLGAAERALRDVLGLDPGNTEARHNLAVLLHRKLPAPHLGGEAPGGGG